MAANVSLFIILHATVPEERVSQKAGPGGIYLVRCQTFTCKTHCKSMFSNSLFQTLLSCSCLAPLTPCPRVSSPVRSQSRPLSLSHAGGAGRTGRIASLLGCCWISSSGTDGRHLHLRAHLFGHARSSAGDYQALRISQSTARSITSPAPDRFKTAAEGGAIVGELSPRQAIIQVER